VRNAFGLHELAVEDARTFHLRPKVDLYEGGVRLVILRTARYDDDAEEIDFGEISAFVAPGFVITVRQGVASELRPARQRLEQRPDLLAASVLWAILDHVVDGYTPVVAGLEDDIDQIEATVFSETAAPAERILFAAPGGHRLLPGGPSADLVPPKGAPSGRGGSGLPTTQAGRRSGGRP
jgi:magnesium transporter